MFDPTYTSVDMGTFINIYWKSIYDDVKEMITSNAPVTCGKEVDLHLFVDADHAGEQFFFTSRFHSSSEYCALRQGQCQWRRPNLCPIESLKHGIWL
jgi:hypothetical protein